MNKTLKIKELPISERPYEKCESYGPEFLSDAELLSVIIRTGSKNFRATDVAAKILNYSSIYEGLLGLNYITINELMSIDGIGRVKAIQILCVVELAKRMAKVTDIERLQFDSPEAVAKYCMQDMRHLETEQIILLLFNSKNRLLKEIKLSQGTVNASLATPREVFIYALRYGAVRIILLHNHPSGDPSPSKEDILITKRIRDSGSLIGIELIDHIIIGDNKFISLGREGVLSD